MSINAAQYKVTYFGQARNEQSTPVYSSSPFKLLKQLHRPVSGAQVP